LEGWMSGIRANEEYNRPSTLRVVKTFIGKMAFDVAPDDPMIAAMVVVFCRLITHYKC
jgi:hypothetical protein